LPKVRTSSALPTSSPREYSGRINLLAALANRLGSTTPSSTSPTLPARRPSRVSPAA
jgi:hypothetical protein